MGWHESSISDSSPEVMREGRLLLSIVPDGFHYCDAFGCCGSLFLGKVGSFS